ncbi:MAG: S26 family signal peptidase [Candidatus Limnocylindria bacterium]
MTYSPSSRLVPIGRRVRRGPFALAARLLLLWLRRRLLVVDVVGTSMSPTLTPGDRLLCAKSDSIWLGAIVVRRPEAGARVSTYLIKRVLALPGERRGGTTIPLGYCWLEGDSPTSVDSRSFGPVSIGELAAVAVARLSSDGLTDLRRSAQGPTR